MAAGRPSPYLELMDVRYRLKKQEEAERRELELHDAWLLALRAIARAFSAKGCGNA